MDVLHFQAMLGHASLDMVQHYAGMIDEDLLQSHKAHSPGLTVYKYLLLCVSPPGGIRECFKRIDEEVGTNYRFFLGSPSHAAFAGDLIILYGVISLTFSIYKDTRALAWIIPALASPIGIFLWIIDVRIRDLYHATIRAGKT